MNNLKEKIKVKISNNRLLYRVVRYIYTVIKHPERLPKKMSCGELNPDKNIFIIRPNSEDCVQGFLSLFIQSLRWIDYANRKGYCPYIDYKNYQTQYSDGSNVWDYYFTQPNGMSYDEAYASKKIILSGPMIFEDVDYRLFEKEIFCDEALCEKCNRIIWDNIQLSKELNEAVEREMTEIDIYNCIGVYIRGTDYIKLKPSGEFVQPQIDEVIQQIDIMKSRNPENKVFLVTEDGDYYNILKTKYDKDIITIHDDFHVSNYDGHDYLSKSNVLDADKKRRGMIYLVKIIMLSRCSKIITSITRGSIAAYAMNGGIYKEKFVFDLGLYP